MGKSPQPLVRGGGARSKGTQAPPPRGRSSSHQEDPTQGGDAREWQWGVDTTSLMKNETNMGAVGGEKKALKTRWFSKPKIRKTEFNPALIKSWPSVSTI